MVLRAMPFDTLDAFKARITEAGLLEEWGSTLYICAYKMH
jgi:hypothetical protein